LFDVAIIGGGPAGSTVGTLLKKYDPSLTVAIFERERFPRDHVGESHLPVISLVLDEMGVWDKVEAANFPIKIGATYKWGRTGELWDFEFMPSDRFKNEARPAKFVGQRRKTAFQVDRAIYDEILLNHAQECGCDVFQEAAIREVKREGDRVSSLMLASGETIQAGYYVDASGHGGILRRAMGVHVSNPTSLQNIAIWDYWQNADWAVEIGVGGTRIQVISLGYGWIWFIPLSPTRTSVGLVVPADYYKSSGQKPAELYDQALGECDYIRNLMTNAVSEGKLSTTRDWSFQAERFCGDNWFLAGESGGFADPILSAGMSMAHYAGKEVAATILELRKGRYEDSWLKSEYGRHQAQRIGSHIRFADYWYTQNEQFVDLQAFTAEIARERGLDLSPEKAWAWLAAGGFVDEDFQVGIAGFSITSMKQMGEFLGAVEPESPVEKNNVFRLDLVGAERRDTAHYGLGEITRDKSYVRNGKVLPVQSVFEFLLYVLMRESEIPNILALINREAAKHREDPAFLQGVLPWLPQGLEAMISDGWVEASYDAKLPLVPLGREARHVKWNTDPVSGA
jgi:flavin-dependent dehydrogenase